MKFVLNKCFGGFSLSNHICVCLQCDPYDYCDYERRNDPMLVTFVEGMDEWANGRCAKLEVIEIPDTATDWEINDYDGYETLIYVVDGKLRHA